MKLKVSRFTTREEAEEYRNRWHRWFAWHPVFMSYGKIVWLQTIERHFLGYDEYATYYEYREISTE